MDKTFYRAKVHEMLADNEHYAELTDLNYDDKIIKKIRKHLKKFDQETTKKEKEYLQNFAWKTSNFYGLPKIHKSQAVKEAILQQNSTYIKVQAPPDLKLRPIVAGPSSPTHRLSNFTDIVLKPLCKHVPSFIRDDLDFLNHLPQTIDENALLVSFDVVSLHTSIPHELGLAAVEYWINNFTDSITRPFSKEFIMESITIVLKENTFHFDNKLYKQIQGTAMGTKMAPTYATLVLGYLEKKLYLKFETQFGTEDKEEFVQALKRYLDDCFAIWNKSEEDLKKLHAMLNSLHESIKFTVEYDNVKLPFLDVLVYKQNNKLNTDIFYKATDTNQYLNFNSCHPKHAKTNIPYSLARRICCIVSDADIKTKRLNELENFLLQQNYPKSLITKGVEKATSLSQEELRAPKNRNSNTKTLPLVLTHNLNNPQIINRIKQNLQFLKNSEKIKPILENTKLIVSRRQPKNLKKQLTQARFVSERTYNTVTQCGEPRCGTCAIIMTGIDIKLKNGKTWHVKCPMNCKSRNIIYILICAKCRSFYVGQTENLRQQVTLHRQQINHEEYSHLAVSEHIRRCSNGKFQIMPIYQCDSHSSRLIRESKERDIITILQPDLNSC